MKFSDWKLLVYLFFFRSLLLEAGIFFFIKMWRKNGYLKIQVHVIVQVFPLV